MEINLLWHELIAIVALKSTEIYERVDWVKQRTGLEKISEELSHR